MSERNPESREHFTDKPNLLQDFDRCVEAVVAIESELSSQIGPKERSIIREQIGNALGALEEKTEGVSEEEKLKFGKRAVTGFQGLGGWNRYLVRGDGSIGLMQSHSTRQCINKAQELGIETPEYGF